jgi:outer membrane lipoprotein-sorting protein
MNISCKSLGLLFALALAGAISGCTQADPLESLIARHVEARGGMERLEAIQTLRASGRASAGPGQEALVMREVRPPGRVRTEFTFQGVTAVYACDGSKCWSVDPLSGSFEPELMSELDSNVAIAQADILGSLVNWEAKGHSVELLGKEQVDGRDTFKLQVTLSSGAVQTDYLDAESALLVRRETTEILSGRSIEVETTYSDYRPVGDVVFPHFIRSSAKGRPDYLEVVVLEAELNPPLDDARFEMPD